MSTNSPIPRNGAVIAVACGMLAGFLWFCYEWTWNRIYVDEGWSLQLRYKGPPLPLLPGSRPPAASGSFAKVEESGDPAEIGVLEQMVGPGRHFYNPLWWERTLVKDLIIEPGEVGIVTSKMGAPLSSGQFLVDGDIGSTKHQGILRKPLPPGRYRINSYGYEVKVVKEEATDSGGGQIKHGGWVNVPSGYVGVVTNLTDNLTTKETSGIQDKVLQPGLYLTNPREQQVDVVKVGYRENSVTANLVLDKAGDVALDASGEPMIADDNSGIAFPSKDGFTIHMDFTAIWGIMPDQAANVIRRFGNIASVEQKVVLPQIESICRNEGSKLGAVDLLVGDSRQVFQLKTSENFKKVLEDKEVSLLYGLVRHIYIPQEVRLPIQDSYIAEELKLTREQEQITTKTQGTLAEEKEKVKLETERTRVETEKLVAKQMAEGQKEAEQTKAETTQLVAKIDKETAELDAQASVTLGEAKANSKKLLEQAKSEKFRMAVDAFGSGEAYNQWIFATGLPEDVELNLLYAGQGTFWTDLKGFSETMMGRMVRDLVPASSPNESAKKR
jgi:regulator of protease activity HflC (stomatin/prohibitin superfamily)